MHSVWLQVHALSAAAMAARQGVRLWCETCGCAISDVSLDRIQAIVQFWSVSFWCGLGRLCNASAVCVFLCIRSRVDGVVQLS